MSETILDQIHGGAVRHKEMVVLNPKLAEIVGKKNEKDRPIIVDRYIILSLD
jgi:hypothetical protein